MTVSTFRTTLRAGLALAVVSLAGALGASTPATSAPGYDGLWSVLIVTEKGTCDRAYRYPVRISKGVLGNAGDSPITISGRVGGNELRINVHDEKFAWPIADLYDDWWNSIRRLGVAFVAS